MSLANSIYRQVAAVAAAANAATMIHRAHTDDVHSSLFKKNFAMLATVFGAGFVFEVGFNNGMNRLWDNMNRGRQWKDIRHKYLEGAAEEEDDE